MYRLKLSITFLGKRKGGTCCQLALFLLYAVRTSRDIELSNDLLIDIVQRLDQSTQAITVGRHLNDGTYSTTTTPRPQPNISPKYPVVRLLAETRLELKRVTLLFPRSHPYNDPPLVTTTTTATTYQDGLPRLDIRADLAGPEGQDTSEGGLEGL